ncbi:MAG TPA: hypothetical protein VIF15_01815 [Polyangiaceae bacterium]
MLRALAFSRPHACRWGVPVVDRVDPAIFLRTYFVRCMECSYCFDSCCQYGVDVDAPNVARLDAVAGDLAQYTGVPRDRWFTDGWTDDAEHPGGRATRTAVEGGACVFRSRRGRGCLIHSFALERGVDYHELKPMVSVLFPVTFDGGLLHPSTEIEDRSLQCIDDGPSLYRGVRDEIAWYFGAALVAELDAFERDALAEGPVAK